MSLALKSRDIINHCAVITIHPPATVALRNVQVFMTRGRFPAALLVDKLHAKSIT